MDGWESAPALRRLEIAQSRDFAAWLADRRLSLAFSTAATGRLVLVGTADDGKLAVFLRAFDAAYGLSGNAQSLLLASAFQIWRFENAVSPGRSAAGHDRLYVPRVAYTTGDLKVGDVAPAADGTILFANTLFSCIAAAGPEFSFTPLWRPPFISRLLPEDRCHLTGMALEQGLLRYVSMAAVSDEAQGWQRDIAAGGLVVDAASDEAVAEGLALPVSPRLHRGRLWLNEAASGVFGFVHFEDGAFEEVAFCPGWLSGMAFVEGYAVVATSVSRDGRGAGGLPLEHNLATYRAAPQTALCVIDLATGEIAHWLRFDGLPEIRDVAVLSDTVQPAALGLAGEDIRRVLSIGPDRSVRPAGSPGPRPER
ncbi:MAG: TIGR03032 family protein [Rhodospirillaceae bacterium]|nr:TIGR03032 family protein [Rhodospirillaceae bacterium]